jgi:hypothetical protein
LNEESTFELNYEEEIIALKQRNKISSNTSPTPSLQSVSSVSSTSSTSLLSSSAVPKKISYKLTDGGNEEIEILAASGHLQRGSGKYSRKETKKRKSNWLEGDMSRRKEKSSAARNDIKGVESWKYDEDDKKGVGSVLKMTEIMRKQQKDVRTEEAEKDRKWQRERRPDEWDREYDKGKVKKVKTHKKGLSAVGGRGVGGFVNRGSSSSSSSSGGGNRFDNAGKAKIDARKNGKTWESKAPSGTKKRKRRDVSKGGYKKKNKYSNKNSTGGSGGYKQLKMKR